MGNEKLKIEDNISFYNDNLENIVNQVSTSYDDITKLQEEVKAMKWSGESRDHFVSLLEVVLQYHQEMKSVGEEFKTNIDELDGDI